MILPQLFSDDCAGTETKSVFEIVQRADNTNFAFFGKLGGGEDFREHGAGLKSLDERSNPLL